MNKSNNLAKRLIQLALISMFSTAAYAASWALEAGAMSTAVLVLSLISAVIAIFVSNTVITEASEQTTQGLPNSFLAFLSVCCGASYGWAIFVFITSAYKLGGYLGYW